MCVRITYIHVRGPETIKRWRWNKLLDAFSVWHTHTHVRTHTRARGRNVKCIRKLENTKTLGTNEQYYVYAMHCMRIDFRKIKKKLLVMKCRRKNLGSDTQIENANVACTYSSIFCAGGIYLFYLIFSSLYSVIDVSAKDRRVTFIILYFIVNVI